MKKIVSILILMLSISIDSQEISNLTSDNSLTRSEIYTPLDRLQLAITFKKPLIIS